MQAETTTKDLDYTYILRAIEELPFRMGRKALIDFLIGDKNNDTIQRNRLDREKLFGSLSGYNKEEIESMISSLATNTLIEKIPVQGRSYSKVYQTTEKGKIEMRNPTAHLKKIRPIITSSGPTFHEEQLMQAFSFFLAKYTKEQQHAIVCQTPNILCVAGAGTGKTTVLTKRIEFLVRFCGVAKERILAITFTRKARQEMEHRLSGIAQVETFNSFCEKILQAHAEEAYGKPVHVIRYADRMRLLHHAIRAQGKEPSEVIASYFTTRQRNEHSKEHLMGMLVSDCFGILDHYTNSGRNLEDFSGTDITAKTIYRICEHIRAEMIEQGLRDYGDQITDTIRLFKKRPDLIHSYDHILIDEYQDVNIAQQQLIDLLSPPNVFAVGDPRQSIFGWRGSKIQFILDFPQKMQPSTTIVLRRNYRSKKKIVSLSNQLIRRMQMPDLESSHEQEGILQIIGCPTEEHEAQYIAQQILSSKKPREEIFVLARTNRNLEEISATLSARGIPHVLRSEETSRVIEAGEGQVTLATVHAIKGMEATLVFVARCNVQSFPCIVSDRPLMDKIRNGEEPDREEEELRLLYVALTRAKEELFITYSGTPSKFLASHIGKLQGQKSIPDVNSTKGNLTYDRLRAWRTEVARKKGMPPYIIFPDKTLIELATQKPATLQDLERVNGIGPIKIQQYGEEILDIIAGK